MAAIAERESVIESEAVLARLLPEPPAEDAMTAAEPEVGKPEASRPRLDVEADVGGVALSEPARAESSRRKLEVRLPAVPLPGVIRPERNRLGPVDLLLIRREY